MYVFLLVLVPILLLFNSYLAMATLLAAIVSMYLERTRPAKRRRPASDSGYTPGYED